MLPSMYLQLKRKKGSNITILKSGRTHYKLWGTNHLTIFITFHSALQMQFIMALTIHQSNAFPVTRHYFKMMCDKDILQLFFEDLNQSTSPLKISYHYITSVTVSTSNTYQVYEGRLLSRHVLHGHFNHWMWDQSVIPKHWNRITTLCSI